MMRSISKKEVYLIDSEPGDLTRYNYYLIPDTSSGISIVPNKSTFPFPTSIERWEADKILTLEDADEFIKKNNSRCKNVNPYTLLEVCNAINQTLYDVKPII